MKIEIPDCSSHPNHPIQTSKIQDHYTLTIPLLNFTYKAECSNLGGLMSLENLPADVDEGAVRQCVDGPSGSSETSDLEKRDCWYGKKVGCSKSGYCYKKCGVKDSGMSYGKMHTPSPPSALNSPFFHENMIICINMRNKKAPGAGPLGTTVSVIGTRARRTASARPAMLVVRLSTVARTADAAARMSMGWGNKQPCRGWVWWYSLGLGAKLSSETSLLYYNIWRKGKRHVS